jgi:hypothetical protein
MKISWENSLFDIRRKSLTPFLFFSNLTNGSDINVKKIEVELVSYKGEKLF